MRLRGVSTTSNLPRGKTVCGAQPQSTSCLYDDLYQWESLLDNNAEKPISFFFFPDTQPYSTVFMIVLWKLLTLTNHGFISDINALILDYLTMEGYPNAAAKFSKEANLQPQQDISSIRARQEIQNCIHSGNIQSAIETLNDLDPEVSNTYYIHLSPPFT